MDPYAQVDLQYDLRFLSLAGSLTASRSREDYYSRLQAFLCVPGQCTDQQIPSCFRDHGKNMTEHQKLQLDLFHILPAPSGGYEVCYRIPGKQADHQRGSPLHLRPFCLPPLPHQFLYPVPPALPLPSRAPPLPLPSANSFLPPRLPCPPPPQVGCVDLPLLTSGVLSAGGGLHQSGRHRGFPAKRL